MNWAHKSKLRLFTRNEGKIKSYESCVDIRAWSHDLQARNNYLRDWMRSDMPVGVIPLTTVSFVLRNMTWRNRAKVAPRCHPNCKSKVVLESICNSTNAIKECLKNEECFEKHFQDEEIETSTWPCEKCLEALKNIKMFWRIILEKIFRIKVPTADDYVSVYCSSVQTIAKSVEDDIVEQAIYVRNLISTGNKHFIQDDYQKLQGVMDQPISSIRLKIYGNDIGIITPVESKPNILKEDKCTETEKADYSPHKKIINKLNQSVTAKFKTVDCACETSDFENEELTSYKNNVEYLQKRLDMQNIELSRLTKENVSMRLELQQIYRTYNWEKCYNTRPTLQNPIIEDGPIPFESCEESLPVSTDSEMIITMKNCKNENFNNISLLQVIHKSNESGIKKSFNEQYCKRQEDPVELLTKVKNTFGSIVQREIAIVNERPEKKRTSLINAAYFNVSTSKSAPSTTLSLHSMSSASVFVSTTE